MSTLEEIYKIYQANPVICHDSRKIEAGCIYWAIRGEKFDGNTFAKEAFKKGAVYAVIDKPEFKINDRCLLVTDSLKMLQNLAARHRQELRIPVIAITGSNGKTTTKELAAKVLARKYNTFATPGNFNNHIGLPLSLLQITSDHEVAVIELGANHQGENAFLCEICRPDCGLITNIGKDHLEGFGGMDGVIKANLELFDFLRENDGLAFINADDPAIFKNIGELPALIYGIYNEKESSGLDISGAIAGRFPYLDVIISDHSPRGKEIDIQSQLFGAYNIYNILAAATIGKYFGVELKDIKKAIEGYIPANNRSQIIEKGSNTFIMDAYNANPSSMQGGIEDFTAYPADHKVLILGDMYELGEDSAKEHKAIYEMIDKSEFDLVAFVGREFEKLRQNDGTLFFENTELAKDWFRQNKWVNITFYLKGSRAMKLETIVE